MRYHAPQDMPLRKPGEEGELALCCSCYAKGYGDDSYHPMTADFWYTRGRMLRLGRCRACETECKTSRRGVVSGKALKLRNGPRESLARGEAAYYVAGGWAASVDFSGGDAFAL